MYDVATQDHYLKVTAVQSLPIDVYASLTGGQDMMMHTVDLNHISVVNDRHAAALNHQLESMGLNGVLYSDQPGFYVVNHCSVRGPIPETPEGRQELVDALQKAHGLVVDYDQTSHQLSTKLNLDDLVLLTDQSVYFQ